ncbi:hypothetical protein IW146_005292 [Coemansia sp. RSA 922]|nr:hypothetical protein H4S03_009192 [Coemansia sp. S3946]KAJ2039293.1 hypothetical protein GGI08_008216 [Coemansia sp. S2]KAJ2071697.1 hypothetical protein GGH13_003189 [Coemansia sp. S155-1]KAJ2111521.1 hypothetical protein IW146_005292 [Coemansia sp. RSA 922]KAJ2344466.1 hypothetical protein GGH92_004464 [Coemansia sp. RSA 2673]
MKVSFAALSCLAVTVLAQTNPMPAGDTTSPAPKVADTPVANVVTGQLPQIPQVAQMPSSLTQSLLSRLISYFDMSRVSSVDATTPVMITQVFDSTMNKFTHLSMNVVQSGDVWYLPVCTVDSITGTGVSVAGTAAAGAPEAGTAVTGASVAPPAGASAAPSLPMSCQYGIQLAPVPQNAMRMMLRVMRTMFRAINAAAMEPTRFWFGRPSTGMTMLQDTLETPEE